MRLLLAAGQADLRISLELLLSEQPGVDVVGAASEGTGLLALIETSKPDLIVTDWDLPGRPLASILPECAQLCPSTPLIVLVGNNRDHRVAVAAGADAVVLRGTSPDILLDAFNTLRTQKTGIRR